ncbi:MAG TPA: NUDIX domain-containing protein [Actinomycetes bacterium]|nr:NUDIX domain-containing protein [Actinomycetes bacterium]
MSATSGRRSAGLLLWRRQAGEVEVLLGHMGGPFWSRKDAGAWTIPKGEYDATEDPLVAARREFVEELGQPVPDAEPVPLGEVRQSGGKRVLAWAVEGDLDPATMVSNTVEIEWPPRSGRRMLVPELDRCAWFPLPAAHDALLVGQRPLLERLTALLAPPQA